MRFRKALLEESDGWLSGDLDRLVDGCRLRSGRRWALLRREAYARTNARAPLITACGLVDRPGKGHVSRLFWPAHAVVICDDGVYKICE